MTQLRVEKVCKRFGGVRAVHEVSLTFETGRVHGLIGPNGAGKSTVVGLISGFIRPDSGSMRLDDRDITRLGPSGRASVGIARTFQAATPLVGMTVLDNVLVGMHKRFGTSVGAAAVRTLPSRREEREARASALSLVRNFGLEEVAYADAGDLSFGQLRFLEMARMVAMRPIFMLLDEPAAGLNAVEMARLTEQIRILRDEGVGIGLIDHDVPFVFGLSDVVSVMSFGEMIASGPARDVYTSAEVREAYLGTSAEKQEAGP